MIPVITFIHVLNSLLLIVVVLLQSSKGGGLAGAFGGGGGSSAVFGGRGAGTFLTKMTTALAVLFMLTSLTLTVIGKRSGETSDSVMRQALEQEGRTAAPVVGLPSAALPTDMQAGADQGEAPVAQPEGGETGAPGGE